MDAARAFQHAVDLQPYSMRNRCSMAFALSRAGSRDLAARIYANTIQMDGTWPERVDREAWLLATSHDFHRRDGVRALELALQTVQATANQVPVRYLDTLAAAYAENGDFQQAREWAAKAIEKAKSLKSKKSIGAHLKLYQDRKPYRDDGKDL